MTIHEILYKYWGYHHFRPLQEEIINNIVLKKDTLALLPTGGGKSICFQVPTMQMQGMCLVISPLIALIKDQVESLNKKNIPALMIYSGMPFKQVNGILQNAINGKYKFLYVSPERLETKLFLDYFKEMEIALIAVDEAHCISQWGYDFRPSYLKIAAIREEIPNVPIIALSASATKIVQKDICEKLLFKNENIFQKEFTRPNLSYSIFKVDSKINKTVEILNAVQGTAIVYCKSRKRTKEISDLLQYYNINATHYHAGLSNYDRSVKQQNWIDDKIRVMVCTNAFGMGIDKPNVRTVIHYDVPDCLENYYQEAGRAGRDEKKAFAILLYQENDLDQLQKNVSFKFPNDILIKQVYLSICNYLQITTGAAEGQYFDFDINHFCINFKLDAITVVNCLKALGQEGFLSFSENVFLPTTIQIIASKNELNAFIIKYPYLDNLLKTLLRNYGGILDNPIIISEKNIAFLAKEDVEQVKENLITLQKLKIVEYSPLKETPQIYFINERIPSNNFSFNTITYNLRKKNYQEKVDKMIAYIHLQNECRSNFISNYFGVDEMKKCGVCDICLEYKKKQLSISALQQSMNTIIQKLEIENSISLLDFKNKIFKNKNIDQFQKAIKKLISEEKIELVNEMIILKK